MDLKNKVIAFDADDTLWHNEINYRNAEREFARAMLPFCSPEKAVSHLFEVEGRNIPLLGYGSKTFIIALAEAAMELSGGKAGCEQIRQVMEIGKKVVSPPLELYPDTQFVLDALASQGIRPVLATKGDLKDQLSKLEKSGLRRYFSHIEIMQEKNPAEYKLLLQKLEIPPERFAMVGNSFKSDIRPVLEIGGSALYIPSEIIWEHERTEEFDHPRLLRLSRLQELLPLVSGTDR